MLASSCSADSGSLDQPVDRLPQLVVLDDDRFDDEIGLEPDFLQRLQVGRIRGRDEEPVSAPMQRQHPPRRRGARVDVILVDLGDVERGEVEQRHAERARGEHRELKRGHPLAGEHLLDEAHPGRVRLRLQRFRFLLRHQALLRQRTGET